MVIRKRGEDRGLGVGVQHKHILKVGGQEHDLVVAEGLEETQGGEALLVRREVEQGLHFLVELRIAC